MDEEWRYEDWEELAYEDFALWLDASTSLRENLTQAAHDLLLRAQGGTEPPERRVHELAIRTHAAMVEKAAKNYEARVAEHVSPETLKTIFREEADRVLAQRDDPDSIAPLELEELAQTMARVEARLEEAGVPRHSLKSQYHDRADQEPSEED